MKNTPAFPTPPIILDDESVGIIPDERYHGMTMRQWYKGMAMQLCADAELPPRGIAVWCGEMADAMLADDAEQEGKE